MIKAKSFIKTSLIYFVGNISSKIISFFMLPLYTAYISAGDMGYFDSAMAVVTFFASVLFLDIGSAIMRYMFEGINIEDKNKSIYTGLTIFVSSLSLYIILAVAVGFIFTFQFFFWIALYGFLLCLNTIYGYVARGWGANTIFAIAGLISTIINVVSNLIFILIFKWGYQSLYISLCISIFINIIILEFRCKIFTRINYKYFDKELFIRMLKFCLPLAINSVAFWLLTSANKVIVSIVLNTEQNGYLAIANRFTSIIYLVSTCFQLAWQELAYSRENKKEDNLTGVFYSKAFDLYTRIMLIGILLSIPVIKIIFPYFIDSSYNASASLIPLAMLGTIMTILSSFLGSIFGGIKKTGIIFTSTLAGAIVNIIVIFSLINVIGVMAANIALLAGFTVNVLFRTFVLKRYINLKVKYWYYLIFSIIFILEVYIYNEMDSIYNLLCSGIILCFSLMIFFKEIKEILFQIKKKDI